MNGNGNMLINLLRMSQLVERISRLFEFLWRKKVKGSKVEFDPSPTIGSREILPPSNRRVAITFVAPASGRVTLSNSPVGADGQGLVRTAGQGDLALSLDYHGEVVRQPWFALYSAGAAPVSWIQVLE